MLLFKAMNVIEVSSQEVRFPAAAVQALERHDVVAVTHYGRRRHVVLSEDQFALIAPLLELLEEDARVPSELFMSNDDMRLERELAEDRASTEGENALIAAAID